MLRKLIRKLKAQENQVVTSRWSEIERPNFLHKINKWTQSDDLIDTDGVATHYCVTSAHRLQSLSTLGFFKHLATHVHLILTLMLGQFYTTETNYEQLCNKLCLFISTSKLGMWQVMYIHHPCSICLQMPNASPIKCHVS